MQCTCEQHIALLPSAASSITSCSDSLLCATTQELRSDELSANAQMSSQMHLKQPYHQFSLLCVTTVLLIAAV